MINNKIEVNKEEAMRYMGFRGQSDEMMDSLYEKALNIVESFAAPTSFDALFRSKTEDKSVVIGGKRFVSESLAAHLAGCEEVCLLGCTIGFGIDRQIKKYGLTDSALSAAIQAVSAAYIESYADLCEAKIKDYAKTKGLYLRPRYSPGYGDLALENQKAFFDLIDLSKRTGITLTDNYMMMPGKSITAFIGLSSDNRSCHIGKCMSCTNVNCLFRKE